MADDEFFPSLFKGRTDAWGTVAGECRHEAVTLESYQRHLKGEVSLGVYPVLDDNTVHFFAIDCDTYDIAIPKAIRGCFRDFNIPVYIALSKSQRFHVYGFLMDPMPASVVRKACFRILAKANVKAEVFPKQDAVTKDAPLGNYINIPYFGNERPFLAFDKEGTPRAVPLDAFLDRVKPITEEHLNKLISQLPAPEATPGEKTREKTGGEWVAELLSNPVKFGERDDQMTRLAGYFRARGLPQEVALAILKGVTVEPGDHPFTEKDVAKCVASAYRYSDKGAKSLEVVSLSDLLNLDAGNPSDLIGGILPQQGVCIVAGEPGTGKTWLVLTMARDVAMGQPFLSRFATEKGNVLVIDEENGKNRLKKRMRRLGANDKLPIHFCVMQTVNLSDPSWEAPLRQAIEGCQPKLVILDSLVRIHRGDENAATEVAKLFTVLSRIRVEYGCSLLITHHLRKRSQTKSLNTADQRIRGSSDIAAYTDSMLGLERVDERLVLSQLKNRDGDFFKPLALGIDDIGDTRTEVTVLAEIDVEADKRKQCRELVLHTLKEKGRTLREDLAALAKGEAISDRTFSDALKSLVDSGQIVRIAERHKAAYELKGSPQPRSDLQDLGTEGTSQPRNGLSQPGREGNSASSQSLQGIYTLRSCELDWHTGGRSPVHLAP